MNITLSDHVYIFSKIIFILLRADRVNEPCEREREREILLVKTNERHIIVSCAT